MTFASATVGPLRRRMGGRDPNETGRGSTPLELLFDLTFAAAVAQAAAQLHQALDRGQLVAGLGGYVAVFFAIWWAWMNFTWFASAYDTDDVVYRLLTVVQMAGVLVLAAGVPATFARFDFTLVTIGYVIMRAAMITQWLRAAAEHPAGRPTALRYAGGIAVVQAGWIVRLWAAGPWTYAMFAILVVAEFAVPVWAEYRGGQTSWHPGHIGDRYGAFTIIVLGEMITATLIGVHDAASVPGAVTTVLLIAGGGLLLTFGLWWTYFTGAAAGLRRLPVALVWGFGHYLVLAAVAALGSGISVALTAAVHPGQVSARFAAVAVAIPVIVYLLVLAWLHQLVAAGAVGHRLLVFVGAAVVLALAFTTPALGLGGAILAMGVTVAATLTANLATVGYRQTRAIPEQAR